MTAHHSTEPIILSPDSCLKSARRFNLYSMVSALVFPLVIPMMFWIAGSIFVYASIAHHPDERVVHYNRHAGYRFYGAVGLALLLGYVFLGLPVKDWIPHWEKWYGILVLWAIVLLMIIPLGVREHFRAGKEIWKEIVVQPEVHPSH